MISGVLWGLWLAMLTWVCRIAWLARTEAPKPRWQMFSHVATADLEPPPVEVDELDEEFKRLEDVVLRRDNPEEWERQQMQKRALSRGLRGSRHLELYLASLALSRQQQMREQSRMRDNALAQMMRNHRRLW